MTRPGSSPGKAHRPQRAAKAGAPKKPSKPKATAAPKHAPKPGLAGNKMARKLALMVLRRGAGRLLDAGGASLQNARNRFLAVSGTAAATESRGRPPIQCSVDVGVPVRVAWREWMKLDWLPEGVHQVQDIERGRRGKLRGRIGTASNTGWRAEVLDEREEQSFAWQSRAGSDCAGLITFHELGEHLTRIELSLDVLPTTVTQAAALSARVAVRRAQAGLRRFKARLEVINPDLYDDGQATG
jgi:uncharacterized membrane protein